MDIEQDYARYYRILGLRPDCEWRDVRAAYRKKVAIWHPDRLPDIEGIRESAEAKFKDVSIAYQAISSYYNEVGMMPEVAFYTDDFATGAGVSNAAAEDSAADDFDDYVAPPPRRRRRRKQGGSRVTWVVVLLLVVFFVVYMMSIQSWDRQSAADRQAGFGEHARYEAPREPARSSEVTRLPRVDKAPKLNISRGLSKRWVLQIQGEPMLKSRDTWDYGISKIYFRDDLVTGWYSSPLDPLRVD